MFLLFGAFEALAVALLGLCFYAFSAYVMFRIGDKFGNRCSFFEFLIPFYNLLLLCDCAGVARWTAAAMAFAPFAALLSLFACGSFRSVVLCSAAALFIFSWGYLWGSVARRLGKNFLLWGASSVLFGGIPVLFLAFDQSLPPRR